MNVIDTGVKFMDLKDDWLFDGEYITKTKDNTPKSSKGNIECFIERNLCINNRHRLHHY